MDRIDARLPRPLHGTAATRRIEHAAQATLPPHALMQRAGLAVARLALALAPHAQRVWIACGPGNNGGDGFEAALHLQAWGKAPVVTWLGDDTRAPADALASLARARAAGVRFADEPPVLTAHDLAIDALLGLGTTRAPEGRLLAAIGRLNAGPAPVLAIDLPSGLDGDHGTGHGSEAIVRARHTLSLLTLKPGLFTAQGRDAAGDIWFDDLGCAPVEAAEAWLIGAPPAIARAHATHKGSFGDVVVVGGAPGMAGAALLAGTAALHAGAGRVLVGLLDPGAAALDAGQPELMLRNPESLDYASATVVCGCGGGEAVKPHLPLVLAEARALVLDADALNAVAADAALVPMLQARAAHGQPTVLTPHPLEAARLLGRSTAEVQAHRLDAARALAERFGCTVVLKGSGTVVAAPGRPLGINPTGNARLATAGTGDVLAGLVGARLAAGLDAFDAACAAVQAHGMAADRWPTGIALTAGALARSLGA